MVVKPFNIEGKPTSYVYIIGADNEFVYAETASGTVAINAGGSVTKVSNGQDVEGLSANRIISFNSKTYQLYFQSDKDKGTLLVSEITDGKYQPLKEVFTTTETILPLIPLQFGKLFRTQSPVPGWRRPEWYLYCFNKDKSRLAIAIPTVDYNTNIGKVYFMIFDADMNLLESKTIESEVDKFFYIADIAFNSENSLFASIRESENAIDKRKVIEESKFSIYIYSKGSITQKSIALPEGYNFLQGKLIETGGNMVYVGSYYKDQEFYNSGIYSFVVNKMNTAPVVQPFSEEVRVAFLGDYALKKPDAGIYKLYSDQIVVHDDGSISYVLTEEGICGPQGSQLTCSKGNIVIRLNENGEIVSQVAAKGYYLYIGARPFQMPAYVSAFSKGNELVLLTSIVDKKLNGESCKQCTQLTYIKPDGTVSIRMIANLKDDNWRYTGQALSLPDDTIISISNGKEDSYMGVITP